jgi:eukaryotic-like serine/threonine-protein kinase
MTKSERSPSSEGIETLLVNTPYRPLWPLGRGSMGEVWAIRHEFIERDFALKVLHQRHIENSQLVERLKQEARAMSALEHPNIVDVVDFWVSSDGRPCLVMELLCGMSLNRLLVQQKQLGGADVITIGRQALSALGAAHAIGVVHRDIKPENMFIHQLPSQPWGVKLLDFGLARVTLGGASGSPLKPLQLTRTGTILGSPRFLSPEAMNGERVGPQGDLYSLGIVLYLCLVGLYSHFDNALTPIFHPPSQCGAADCSPELDAIILRALEPERAHRYSSAVEFLEALDNLGVSSEPAHSRCIWDTTTKGT